eukprot:3874572-Pyramimonas_sp.AAC.1
MLSSACLGGRAGLRELFTLREFPLAHPKTATSAKFCEVHQLSGVVGPSWAPRKATQGLKRAPRRPQEGTERAPEGLQEGTPRAPFRKI